MAVLSCFTPGRIAFVAVIQFIELAILRPLERRANQWRR
jgi:hypothetical protein